MNEFHYPGLEKLLDYFVDTWIGDESKFDREFWNHSTNVSVLSNVKRRDCETMSHKLNLMIIDSED